MKKILFIASFFLLFTLVSFSQSTYKGSFIIKDLSDNNKLEYYTKAIENANFEQYRLQNENVILEFVNGFKLELLSAKLVFTKNPSLNMSGYREKVDENYQWPKFNVLSESAISAIYPSEKIKK